MKDKRIVENEPSFSKNLNREIERINQENLQSKIGSYRKLKLTDPPENIENPERHHLNEKSSFPELYKKGAWSEKRLCIYLSGKGNGGSFSHHNCHLALLLMARYCKEDGRKLKVWEYDLGLFLGLFSSNFDEKYVCSIIELVRLERKEIFHYGIDFEIENPYLGVEENQLKNIENGVEAFFKYFLRDEKIKQKLIKKKLILLNSKKY